METTLLILSTITGGDTDIHLYNPRERQKALDDMRRYGNQYDLGLLYEATQRPDKTWVHKQIASVTDGDFEEHPDALSYARITAEDVFTQRYL